MSVLGRLVGEIRGWTQFGIENNFWGDWGSATSTYSGVAVSQSTAMACSAVYACVGFIAETLATLPVDVVQRYGTARYGRPKPAWLLEPNPITRLDWIGFAQQVVTSLLLDGNAFVGVVRMPGERTPASLWPLDPRRVTIEQERNGSLIYRLDGNVLPSADVMHVRGITMPGQIRGLSPVEQARQSIGRTMAAEKYASSMFANMATPGAVISVDKDLGSEEAKDIARRWDAAHAGTDKAFRTAVFGSGAKVSTITLTPEQVQMIETMRWGVLDIARIFRVPPYILDPTVTSTWGSGVAEQNIQVKQYTLTHWAARLQNLVTALLYDTYLDSSYTARLDFRGFLKADPVKQAQYLETKMRCRALTPNEWRALDDENPLPNGDSTLNSVQWEPAVVEADNDGQ